ncbi:hypothetical protein MMC13_006914 [Lambiella insularis]|nr:hypothetical protein [Lambiella insularis]
MSPLSPHKKTALQIKPEKALKSPPSSLSDGSLPDSESVRGRPQDRDSTDDGKLDDNSGEEVEDSSAKLSNGQHRKRKRSRKGLDKKYHCPQGGCGKSYSRAEHLYRHQLNHTPKQIYKCDFPDCTRQFVRQDLCARHRERHTTRGAHLQRKDSYMHNANVVQPQAYPPSNREILNHPFQPIHSQNNHTTLNNAQFHQPTLEIPAVPLRSAVTSSGNLSAHVRSPSSTPLGDHFRSPQSYQSPAGASAYAPIVNRSNSDGQYYSEPTGNVYNSSSSIRNAPIASFDAGQRHASFGSVNSDPFKPTAPHPQAIRGAGHSSPTQYHTGPTSYAPSNGITAQRGFTQHGANGAYTSQQHVPTVTLPPPLLNTMQHTSQSSYHPYSSNSVNFDNSKAMHGNMNNVVESPTADSSVPVFGGDGYAPSPSAITDDFAAWLGLLSDTHFNIVTPPMGLQSGPMSTDTQSYIDSSAHNSYLENNLPVPPPQHPMAVTSILDSSLPETILSEEKRQELLELIDKRFNETNHAPVHKQKEELFSGNSGDGTHVLSLRMMQTYIGSYWYHFHPQMPILHKPTFSADKAQNLLLIAVIAIGASCLDQMHGHEITQASAELSSFLAWHLRGEIFTDKDFRPPAKLWIFQALLLLEVYEKMYSTRVLHERAHIHHATTLTLMRRGRTLRGRSALDSPPSLTDEKMPKSSSGSPSASIADTPDTWWNHWITNEATRRVAFAAFVIDSTHATMFGHSATMVAHEMRLPLPCDESLWSATSGLEVGRIEANLHTEGIKPIPFLEGLKRTLNGEPVRTNSFGRTALMAGLLSVSWHMNQRDMQIRSLGVIGGKDLWRGTLTKAFDKWEKDFDFSGAKTLRGYSPPGYQSPPGKLDEENIFESRTVLHHLAHMAMHVDIVQCQIFAKANRLLGRTITPPDYNSAQRNIRDIWAPKPSARDATFYALKFLSQVLTPDIHPSSHGSHSLIGMGTHGEYSARNDFLLNRPWVLYFAALIVWSYGFALDGPLRPPPILNTVMQQKEDMRLFLRRASEVKSPQDLAGLKNRNACMGMLMVLGDEFRQCRWEISRFMHALGKLRSELRMSRSAPKPLLLRKRVAQEKPGSLESAPVSCTTTSYSLLMVPPKFEAPSTKERQPALPPPTTIASKGRRAAVSTNNGSLSKDAVAAQTVTDSSGLLPGAAEAVGVGAILHFPKSFDQGTRLTSVWQRLIGLLSIAQRCTPIAMPIA